MAEEIHESEEVVRQKVQMLAEWVKASANVVAFTGAGVSTSAGIPDFRGPRGVWTMQDKGVKVDRNFNFDVTPTPCHMALVELREQGLLTSLVSTNTDGMHLRTGFPIPHFQEVHGNKNIEACAGCGKLYYRGKTVRRFMVEKTRITERRCDDCHAPLRWTNVAFGQSMPDLAMKKAKQLSKQSDLSLVLGTTMAVEPAASLATAGKSTHGRHFKLVLVNLQQTGADSNCDLRIFAKTDLVMEMLMEELGLEIPQYKDLDLVNNQAWLTEFANEYAFRSVGQEWYEGPDDPSVLPESLAGKQPSQVNQSVEGRQFARAKRNTKAQNENEIVLVTGELLEVLKTVEPSDGSPPWCYVMSIGRNNEVPLRLGYVFKDHLQFL